MNKNFKWPISSSIKIDASVSNVWEAITAPGNLNDCHPFCEKNNDNLRYNVRSNDVQLQKINNTINGSLSAGHSIRHNDRTNPIGC